MNLNTAFEGEGRSDFWNTVVADIFSREISSSLRRVNIFDRVALREAVNAIVSHKTFRAVAGKEARLQFAEEFQNSQLNPKCLEINDPAFRLALRPLMERPLQLVVSPGLSGSLAIFRCLESVLRLPVEINFRFANTVEIYKRLLSGKFTHPPDICVLSVAVAASFLGSGKTEEYIPAMLLPCTSQRVISANVERTSAKKLSAGEYLFMCETPSAASFYYDRLADTGLVDRNQTIIQHMEPDEVMSMFQDGPAGLNAILWFPYYHMNLLFNKVIAVNESSGNTVSDGTILFVHKSLYSDKEKRQALLLAMRSCWQMLLNDEQTVQDTVKRLIKDEELILFLNRCSGLHNLSPEKRHPADSYDA